MESFSRWRKRFLVLLPVLLLTDGTAFAIGPRSPDGVSPKSGQAVDGNELIQRRVHHIRQVRKAVIDESLDQSIRGLLNAEAYNNGVYSQVALDQLDFKVILSNRRTLKIVAELSKLPKEAARDRCQAVFDDFFEKEYQATIERGLRMYEDPNAPRNTQTYMLTGWRSAPCSLQ